MFTFVPVISKQVTYEYRKGCRTVCPTYLYQMQIYGSFFFSQKI